MFIALCYYNLVVFTHSTYNFPIFCSRPKATTPFVDKGDFSNKDRPIDFDYFTIYFSIPLRYLVHIFNSILFLLEHLVFFNTFPLLYTLTVCFTRYTRK